MNVQEIYRHLKILHKLEIVPSNHRYTREKRSLPRYRNVSLEK